MQRRRLHVIAYDISDDARRTRMARFLLDYGDRVQYSLFEAELTPEEVETIRAKAAPLLEETDSLRIYPLCAECARQAWSLGREGPADLTDLVII